MFREEFKQQEGVQELKCGVMYKVEASGKGKTPKLSDWIKVNYAGKHVDGRVFDKSKEESRRDCGWIGLFLVGRRCCRE